MTNDTTTLNGSLRQLGETMASNLTTQGVPSTYDEGLTTLAGKILDIQGGGGRTLTLVSDVDILSFADGDEATLTATLLEDGSGVGGESVEFYRYVDGVNDVLIDTQDTNSSGVATGTYTSAGIGDIQVYAKVRTLVSKRYEVEDCWKYFTESSASISNFQLPSGAFKLECSVVKTGNYNGVIHLWQTSNTTVGFGFLNTADYNYDLGYYNGSSWNRQTLGTSSSGQSVSLTLTYANGVFTLSDGTNSITLNKTCENPLSKFEIEHKTGLSFSNVKIKPL